ncbi:MAG TPA: carbon storage regulator, partial [bacterium]|nr:carbon storage regulator [bacterium]
MLILRRKPDEEILIGDDIKVMVVDIMGQKARLGIIAPHHIPVHREEVYDAIHNTGKLKDDQSRAEVRDAAFVELAEAAVKQRLLSETALENIRSWAWPAYRRAHAQITQEFQKANEETDTKKHKELWTEIDNAWYTKAAPGTAGMRGKLGFGTNRMSEYTLGLFQLAHALAVASPEYDKIVEQQDPDFDPSVERKAVILGGDSRHQSYDPATKQPGKLIKLEALLNVVNGTRAYVYRLPVSTPQVAWSVHQLDVRPVMYRLLEWMARSRWVGWFASVLLTAYRLFFKVDRIVSGSMTTASHNPRTDNGNKPYKPDGSQSTGEFAALLTKKLNEATPGLLDRLEYEELNILDQTDLAFDRAVEKGDIQLIGGGHDVFLSDEQFMRFELEEAIYAKGKLFDPGEVAVQDLKTVISPLYGVSRHILEQMLRIRGLRDDQVVWVESEPNPEFPGVKGGKPNPEEPQARLQALEKAQEVDADLVLWTDPDADRPAVAFKSAPGKYLSLNGNQQLAVITDYLIRELRELAEQEKTAADSAKPSLARQAANIVDHLERTFVASTVVSGDLMKGIARNAGLQVVETLTGFKYIGDEIEKRAKRVQRAANISERQWRELSKEEKIRLSLEYSELFLFGGEESLGSLTSDGPHDKDAIAGLMWFIEIAGRLRKQGIS